MTKAERFRAFLDSVTLKTENLSQPILDECRGEYEEAKPHNT